MQESAGEFEGYEFDPRYYIHTAKNNVTSFGHVIAEAVSNADEAIAKRATATGSANRGRILVDYEPDAAVLTITDDGVGLTTDDMRRRLKRVGQQALPGAERAFFHRGIREVFMAMGACSVESIAQKDGALVYTRAIFDPLKGMAIIDGDVPVSDTASIAGVSQSGTRLTIPLRRLAQQKPGLFTFPKLRDQIENCVQIRPVLMDDAREVTLEYGDAPPRRMRFAYPDGEDLFQARDVNVGGMKGTLWARVADDPIPSGWSRQTRRYGILIRGKRAAYEVSLGTKLQTFPGHRRVCGELRVDEIEELQRAADARADDEAQLIYKADRGGLNPDHPLAEAIYQFLDDALGASIAGLESKERTQNINANMRRQLHELAVLINDAVKLEDFGDVQTPTGTKKEDVDPRPFSGVPPEPPDPRIPPDVEDGIGLARSRIFIQAGKDRGVKVWFDTAKVPVGTEVLLDRGKPPILRFVRLAGAVVPPPPEHGIAELLLSIRAEEVEGREEIIISAGGYSASLVVHTRFPRASGFIRDIVPVNEDWESGAALYSPETGRVKVYVGRPEFVDAAKRALAEKLADPFEFPAYKLLVAESVREAALRTAAERRAEVLFDDLAEEERREPNAMSDLTLTEYYALDYKLRHLLLKAFAYA